MTEIVMGKPGEEVVLTPTRSCFVRSETFPKPPIPGPLRYEPSWLERLSVPAAVFLQKR